MPLVSVIIPTFNRAHIIERAIESVRQQTFQDWECLVVDDHSTDNTKEFIEKYKSKDSRIKYFINERTKGANGARNTGIIHAKGIYISFLDSDDCWHRNMLEKQMEKYMSDPSISCVYSKIQTIVNENDKHPWDIFKGLQGNIYKEVLIQGYMSPTITLSVEKKCFEKIGMFDTTLPACQDDDMCFRLAKEFKIGFIPEILADVYANSDNRISDNPDKVSLGWWMLWNKYEADVLEYCGEKVMAKHYKECLHHFLHANNVKMSWKAYRKFSYFGGSLSKRKKIWFIIYFISGGRIQYITKKIQNKL